MNLPHRDELSIQRALDGELSPIDAAAFAARLESEPALREGHAAARALRGAFVVAREVALRPRQGASRLGSPRPGFKAAVLAAVRQLPSRLQIEQADTIQHTVTLCRRLLLAAVLLGSVAFAVGSGLLGVAATKSLQASPGEAQRELDRLEEIVRGSGLNKTNPQAR